MTFVDVNGLAAAQVTNASVSVGLDGATLRAVALRLISPGHFVGDVDLAAAGRYRVALSTAGARATFTFPLREKRSNP